MVGIPQSGLLAQVSSLRLPSGHSGLGLTLSNAACASLSSPCLLVADVSVWVASQLGVAIRHIICGVYLFIYLFFLLVMLPSDISRFATDPLVRVFPGIWNLLSVLRLPSWEGSPSLPLLPLSLSFIPCPTSF